MSEFRAGDVVHLKSGSPPLVVQLVDGDHITVGWFHDGAACEAEFPPQCLLIVGRQEAPATEPQKAKPKQRRGWSPEARAAAAERLRARIASGKMSRWRTAQ